MGSGEITTLQLAPLAASTQGKLGGRLIAALFAALALLAVTSSQRSLTAMTADSSSAVESISVNSADAVTDQALGFASVWVSASSSTTPWSDQIPTAVGLLTFRGNPTRTFHGTGPIGSKPQSAWQYDIGCSNSPVNGVNKEWCGTGWTGQPLVFRSPHDEAKWWLAVGGYNKRINFLDPDTGSEVYPPYATGDIIKGTPTKDPDGFPLIYTGSRDNYFHIVAIDRATPQALYKIAPETDRPTFWNNDWDSSALVLNDYLFIGGENSRFYIFKLNRSYNEAGLVEVDPVEVFSTQAWDDQLLQDIGDKELSIENSVAISGNTVYFANSGGLVQGWSIKGLAKGVQPERTFRYWVGDDVDASIVIDDAGDLYVASQFQRENSRSQELGQLLKLDPDAEEPLLWSVELRTGSNTGVWATPALYNNQVIVGTHEGRLLSYERSTGEWLWEYKIADRVWASPVVVGNQLLQADCSGTLTAIELHPTGDWPKLLWTKQVTQNEACIESTPAVWDGNIFVGSRDGRFYAVRTS